MTEQDGRRRLSPSTLIHHPITAPRTSLLNRLPAEDHGTDFSRVRPWFLDNQAALYRQTIVLSSLMEPQVCGLFHRKCRSHAGKVRIRAVAEQGTCSTLDVPVKQLFQRLHCDR